MSSGPIRSKLRSRIRDMQPNRSILAAALLTGLLVLPVALQAQTEWIALGSEHFLLYTETNANKGGRLLADLEERYQAFSRVFYPLESRASRIRIVLFDNRQNFLEWVPEALTIHDKAAFLVQGSGGPFVLARDSSPESIADDVGHSLGHLLLSRAVLWQPFWLQEGVGEYLRRLGRDGGEDAVSRADGFSLPDVLEIVPSQDYDDLDEGGVFRRQSYHLFRVLVDRHPEELGAYLLSLGQEDGSDSIPTVDGLEDELFQYEDSALPFIVADSAFQAEPVGAGELDAMLGDLASSAGFERRARDSYAQSPVEAARIGLARFDQGRPGSGGRQTFERLVVDFPESGLVHYYLGILEPETDDDLRRQIDALERAVRLMPQSGQARAELGWLYALDERPSETRTLVEEALELEPEFGDRFYHILARVRMRLGDYDAAREYIQIAASLPHSPLSSWKRPERLAPDFYREIETLRRQKEAERVEDLRTEVEALVDRVDPRPLPVVEAPAPIGRISYSIRSGAGEEITAPEIREAPMPDYEADLRRRGVEGRVILEIDLDRRGRISDLRVRSSEDPELSEAALEAVNRWQFDPARRGLESTTYSFRLTMTFYLE